MRRLKILLHISFGATLATLAALTPALGQSVSVGVRLPSETELRGIGLTRAWWAHSVTNSLRDKLVYLVLDDENLYAQSTNGAVTCFASETGQRRWAVQLGVADNPILPLSYNDTYVFAANSSKLYCLQKTNGDIVWELSFPGSPSVAPAVDNSRVYLGMIDGSVYTFDIRKIARLQEQGRMPQWSNDTLLWRYRTSQAIVSPPMPWRHLVAFASQTGSVYSVGAEKRELIFQYKTAAKLSAPMARYKNWLLIPAEDNIFYAISMENGSTKWEYTVGLPIKRTPTVIGERVYFMPLRGGMYQLNAADGTQNWWRPGIEQFLAASPQRVYARDYTGNLVVLDHKDGALLGAMNFVDYRKYLINDLSDRVYLATEGGLIVCLHEPARNFPVFHLHPEKLPIVPYLTPEGGDEPGLPRAE